MYRLISKWLNHAAHGLGLLAVILFFFSANALAAQATLTWDASPGPDLKGYRLYYGQASGITSGQYASNLDVGLGNQTTAEAACTVAANGAVSCKKLNLQDGATYYFAVKAYNSAGTESVFSNEIIKIADSATALPAASFSASSTSAAPLQWTFTNTSTGTVTKRCWKFGAVVVSSDVCESTALNPSYTYTKAGSYTVTLIASNSMGSTTANQTITVNAPPTTALGASLAANKTTGQVPLDVTFSGTWTGAATKWSISGTSPFTSKSGSISTSTTQPVTALQTYSTPGTYTVTFAVTDASGTSKSAQRTITATTTAPTANFTASATSAAPLTAQFTDTSTPIKAVTEWSWNFGESTSTSNTSILQHPTHAYAKAGTYTVQLIARNSAGSNTKTGSITVSTASASTNGLVAAYNFEEASDATVADASGKGNHGAIACNKTVNSSCSVAARTTSGKFGGALSFDGVDDWMTVNDSAALDLTNGMTLEAWVYPTATMSGWRNVLLKEQTGGLAYGLYANSDSSQPVASINIGGDQNLAGSSAFAANSWVHLAATYDGATERLYVNGNQVASRAQTGNMTVSGGVLRIGGNSVWGEYFKGSIDEIRIYNRAVSADEIKTDMNTAVAISSPPILLAGDDPKTGTQTTTDTISKGTAKAFLKKADKTGRVTSLSVNVVSGSTAFDVGLYTNNNGRPGTLLARGTQSAAKAGKNTVPLPATAITAGTTYWIAILSPGGNLQVSDRVGGGTQPSEISPATTSTTLPTTWWTSGTPSYDGPLAGYGAGY